MKLIEQSLLFFQEGNSDKVYEIDLCEVGNDLFVVNFRYGKRGAALKEGTKTNTPVSRPKAQAIFTALEAEKVKKGYEKGAAQPKVAPNFNFSSKEEVILQRLKDAIEGTKSFKTKWKTSRVAWKAGEYQLTETLPYLVQLLENESVKKDDVQKYSVLYALIELHHAQALPVIESYAFDKSQTHFIQKTAQEGVFLLQSTKSNELTTYLLEKLPSILKEFVVANQIEQVNKDIAIRLQEKNKSYAFIETLYLLVHNYPFLNEVVRETLSKVDFRPPFFKIIRSVYKLAELRKDVRMLGMLSYRFEQENAMYKSIAKMPDNTRYYNYYVRKYIPELNTTIQDILKEVKKEDSKIGYSDTTKAYFKRRNLQNLKKFGVQEEGHYVRLATSILLAYQDKDNTKPYMAKKGYAAWDRNERKYRHQFAVIPQASQAGLLHLILNGNNPDFVLESDRWRTKEQIEILSSQWYVDNPALPNQTTALQRIKNFIPSTNNPQRNELFPHQWDTLPQAYIQLLLEARIDLIHEFAYKNLKSHQEYQSILQKIDDKLVRKLLTSSYDIPIFFGVEIAKDKLQKQFDKSLVLLLFQTKAVEGRKLAQEFVALYQSEFSKDTNFIIELLFNPYADVRAWANEFLQKIVLQESEWQVVIGKAIATMLSGNTTVDVLAASQNLLKNHATHMLEKLSWNMVLELLAHSNLQNQIFASDILLLKSQNMLASDIPFSILQGFFASEAEEIRANGMAIFSKYPENTLAEAHELLSSMLISPYQNLRTSSTAIIKRLTNTYSSFAFEIAEQALKALRRKEPAENVHQELQQLLLKELEFTLKDVSLKHCLNFLHANYRPAQIVGFYILKKYVNTEDLTIRQLVSLANHEVLEVRLWVLEVYQKNSARMRYEREDALRILDAKWDDIRPKAMDFFRNNFSKEDWSVETLVSVADSVRPDVEAFGKELITKFFEEKDGMTYLTMLSQHPSQSMQLFASNYLERFASGNLDKLKEMEFYFRSVLLQVNKGRITKDRVTAFLEKEALSSHETAHWVVDLFNDMVATCAIQDKARYIQLLQQLKTKYTDLNVAVVFEAI